MDMSQDRDQWMRNSTRIQKLIRVLLVDDSILTLRGLQTFLSKSQHIEIVGIVSTSAEAVKAIQAYQPDVVVLEVRIGHASGIDLCKAIRESNPNIGVLFFTAHDDKDLLHSAILAGAHGYLLKTAAVEAVAKGIQIVATGQAIMDQELTQQVITWVRDGGSAGQEPLRGICSQEERRLLSFVADGKTNKEIALELNVAPSAVATRLQKIYKRLRISRRSEAARYFVHLEKHTQGRADLSH